MCSSRNVSAAPQKQTSAATFYSQLMLNLQSLLFSFLINTFIFFCSWESPQSLTEVQHYKKYDEIWEMHVSWPVSGHTWAVCIIPFVDVFRLFTGLLDFLQSIFPDDQTWTTNTMQVIQNTKQRLICTLSYTWITPWTVSNRPLAKASLWVKELSRMEAESTSATLLSNAWLNLRQRQVQMQH